MLNLEFKAELRDPVMARSVCRALSCTWIAKVQQVDTYYRVPTGRLKRRDQDGEPTEFILYERPNRTTFKLSRFEIFTQQQALERYGSLPLPVWTTVKKTREIFVLGHTRIHLDAVEGLGAFLELESIVSPQHTAAHCHDDLTTLRRAFQPALGEPIDCSYADLLSNEEHAETT